MVKFAITISGTYMKTACVVLSGGYNQADANNFCISQDMKLFVMDSNATQKFMQQKFQNSYNGDAVFRIDGLRDEAGDNKW